MPPPATLGRLRRVRLIDTGGFATVWLYHDDVLDSDVAVKVLADNWVPSTEIRERFLGEARLLRRADSPHLVRVYDIGVTGDDVPYFVMEYAERGSVADLLDAGTVTPAQLVDLVSQAAEGLTALHSLDIVHRDIKPANLLLTGTHDGGVRLMVADLGVAKSLVARTGVTSTVGSPSWMAPEQLDPSARLDGRTDVRSLGAVAYALLTGTPPYVASPDDLPPPVSSLRPVPPDVDAVVMRALEPDREQRWPDVRSFSSALARACAGAPVDVGSVPMRPPAARRARAPRAGRPIRAIVLLVVLALVALGAAVFFAVANPFGSGGRDPVNAYESTAVRFIDLLRARNCTAAAVYIDNPPDPWHCTVGSQGLYYRIALEIDTNVQRRVEDLGDGTYRVVFVNQGYVVVKQRANTTLSITAMVGH